VDNSAHGTTAPHIPRVPHLSVRGLSTTTLTGTSNPSGLRGAARHGVPYRRAPDPCVARDARRRKGRVFFV